MTPAARVGAAIEVLDRVLAGQAAEQALTQWARGARYAGSGDRAAVRDHVFDALRCRRSYAALSGQAGETGRALMIGALRGGDLAAFSGAPHAPAALSAAERAALAAAPAPDALPEVVRLDCPDWLTGPLRAALGPAYAPVMAAGQTRAPVFLRAHLGRATRDAVIGALAGEGIIAAAHPLAETALVVLENQNKIKQSRAYLDGIVELQDAASQAAVAALPLRDGQRILDYCAGGGGKALAMAARARARITAHDAQPGRMADLGPRAARAGARIGMATAGQLTPGGYDLVLVDAPCSGSGTWRRTPDAKWRLTPARLQELTRLQALILDQAPPLLAPGGALAFMTCSYLRAENEDQVAGFLGRSPGFALTYERRFSALDGGDGFYVAVMSHT